MSASRKGLKRAGMRSYSVTGPKGTWIIERERPWRFSVRPEGWPRTPGRPFFNATFKRLGAARADAERQAGL